MNFSKQSFNDRLNFNLFVYNFYVVSIKIIINDAVHSTFYAKSREKYMEFEENYVEIEGNT